MFEDDPEMQAMIRKAQAEPEPVHKPWWYQLILAGMMLGGAGVSLLIPIAVWSAVDFRVAAFGMLAGGLFTMAVLGWRPGRYREISTDKRMTLWKPLALWLRALFALGSLAVFGLGVGIAWYDASELESQTATRKSSEAASPAPSASGRVPAPKPTVPRTKSK
ncbi:MAG: hypothetical protein HY898_24730 [Deltaproteobacteria bacterium]|nr:hypothetical protein [Deltaproteobacteria bacterium]